MRIITQPFFFLALELLSEKEEHQEEKESKQANEAQGKKRTSKESWIKWLQQEYLQVTGCIYDFLSGFGMNGKCMCVFGSFVVIGMGFAWFDNGFILALPFLDNDGVSGFILG